MFRVAQYKVYMDDMTTGIHYMFMHEIALKQTIDKDNYNALLSFIEIMYKVMYCSTSVS